MTDKLNIGDRIKIYGFVMLKGLNHNRIYKLVQEDGYSYTFRKGYKGKLVRHYKNDIHLWIRGQSDENHIEILNHKK